MYVVRWAYYRALSANTVTWKERHNWVRRLLYKIEKQVREKTIDQLGSVDLFQADDKFYEEVARMVFMCYRKTGDARQSPTPATAWPSACRRGWVKFTGPKKN